MPCSSTLGSVGVGTVTGGGCWAGVLEVSFVSAGLFSGGLVSEVMGEPVWDWLDDGFLCFREVVSFSSERRSCMVDLNMVGERVETGRKKRTELRIWDLGSGVGR